MRVVLAVETRGARLENPEDLSSLSVATNLEPIALAVALEQARLGTFDGSHALLFVDALRGLAPDDLTSDDSWTNRFAEMIAYAGSRGWCDSDGRVRAHLEKMQGA